MYLSHLNSIIKGPGILLTKNNYPYALSPDIRHMIVWSVKQIQLHEYRAEVLKKYSENEYDIIVFENPLGLKSVKTVFHAQILIHDRSHCVCTA